LLRLLSAAAGGVVIAFTLAACGTGGRVERGSLDNGRKLFGEKCGSCHALAAAGTTSEIGPNLDASFAQARADGFKESSIRDIVAGQIRDPGQYSTGNAPDELQANMPPDLVSGQDLADVASFVASNAGTQGFVEPAAVTGTNGETIFKSKCGSCHTMKAAGTTGTAGPNLDLLHPTLERAKAQVISGGGIMPAFKGTLTDAQIDAVAKYVAEQTRRRR
jgi:cbb3-type cytochrome c oxidase subunit III